jgi:hypothetical protein
MAHPPVAGSSKSSPSACPGRGSGSPRLRGLTISLLGCGRGASATGDGRSISRSQPRPGRTPYPPRTVPTIGEGAARQPSHRLSLVSGSVGDTRSEVCWAAISPDSRHVYVINFGDGTVSSSTIAVDGRLELLQPVAATTVAGQKGVRDEAMSRDGRYLFALHADVQQLFGWRVQQDGSLTPLGPSATSPRRSPAWPQADKHIGSAPAEVVRAVQAGDPAATADASEAVQGPSIRVSSFRECREAWSASATRRPRR